MDGFVPVDHDHRGKDIGIGSACDQQENSGNKFRFFFSIPVEPDPVNDGCGGCKPESLVVLVGTSLCACTDKGH